MIQYKTDDYNPTVAIHPGLTLSETLESIGMTQVEFSQRTSRPEKTISEIINGTTAITPETAIQFERVLGIPSSFWNNLEKNYQEIKAKIASRKQLQGEIELAKKYPLGLMMKRGWIKTSDNLEVVVESLLSFFGVNSISLVNKVMDIAYRNHKGKSIYEEGLQVWLRKGEIDSSNIETLTFNEEKLKEVLVDIKSYTNKDPQSYLPELRKKLSDCGIAIVFTPSIPKTYVCGTARWLNPTKARVQLSLRGGFADIMWFTLFHELGHILLHSKKMKHIDFEGQQTTNTNEEEADKFASDLLIPKERYEALMKINYFNTNNLRSFAQEIGVDVGIVIGRLQHDKLIDFKQFNSLRSRYKFIDKS